MTNTEKILALSLAKLVWQEGFWAEATADKAAKHKMFQLSNFPEVIKNPEHYYGKHTNKYRIKVIDRAIKYYNSKP